jgi:hypothetical protein
MSQFSIRDFRVTFGQQYRTQQHPVAINGVYPHPDGWFVIEAMDPPQAMRFAITAFGGRYSNVYRAEDFDDSWYPLGELGRIPYGTVTR